jgi:hypothetical protein
VLPDQALQLWIGGLVQHLLLALQEPIFGIVDVAHLVLEHLLRIPHGHHHTSLFRSSDRTVKPTATEIRCKMRTIDALLQGGKGAVAIMLS